MVLESILTPQEVEKQPLDMFLLGFLVASLSLWLAYYIFPDGASSWFLFLTTLAVVPLMLRLMRIEEGKEEKLTKESLWQRHDEIIFVYLFLFFGMVVAFSFWFTILPNGITNIMFKDQVAELSRLQGLRASLTGAAAASGMAAVSGAIVSKATLLKIIMVNNLRLLFLFVLFSFIFGTGAILLLTWNAAVVGVAVGDLIKGTIVATASLFNKTTVYFKTLPISILGFFLHGIFEILGYFIGAIAGGILSVAIVRKHYDSPHFKRVALDIIILLAISIALIVAGAYIEVYVTPVI